MKRIFLLATCLVLTSTLSKSINAKCDSNDVCIGDVVYELDRGGLSSSTKMYNGSYQTSGMQFSLGEGVVTKILEHDEYEVSYNSYWMGHEDGIRKTIRSLESLKLTKNFKRYKSSRCFTDTAFDSNNESERSYIFEDEASIAFTKKMIRKADKASKRYSYTDYSWRYQVPVMIINETCANFYNID